MNQQRLKAKNSMLRFYTLQDVEYGRGSSNFGQVLQVRVMLFHKVLNEMRVELPIDSMISKRKMNRRVERCCLLFKSSERILQALHDLRKLGEYIQMIRPVLMPLDGYTQDVLKLGFDLDHVFLVDYVLKAGKVVDISGFHSDYLRESRTTTPSSQSVSGAAPINKNNNCASTVSVSPEAVFRSVRLSR